MITVGQPATIEFGGPLSTMVLPIVAAGIPPISTVGTPGEATPPTWGTTPVVSGHGLKSERARQAGIPPISTVGQPAPVSGEPWAVGSPTRAAGGICDGPHSADEERYYNVLHRLTVSVDGQSTIRYVSVEGQSTIRYVSVDGQSN